uniref:Uncharacterized protein n=1 Tax=Cacopsylla melanoneura TaxID=428564 RepID=A0A8D8VK19_9HEMI
MSPQYIDHPNTTKFVSEILYWWKKNEFLDKSMMRSENCCASRVDPLRLPINCASGNARRMKLCKFNIAIKYRNEFTTHAPWYWFKNPTSWHRTHTSCLGPRNKRTDGKPKHRLLGSRIKFSLKSNGKQMEVENMKQNELVELVDKIC